MDSESVARKPTMKRVGVSELRKMNAAYIRNLQEPLEICHGHEPVRVLIPYGQYLELQDAFRKLAEEEVR